MRCGLDIETVPCADKQPYIDAARTDFKAPSGLTKAQAGADLKMSAEEIKFTSAGDLTARWEKEMAEIKAPEVADINWRKTALDGTYGRVVSVSWSLSNGAKATHCRDPLNERENLQEFVDALTDALAERGAGRPPLFIGHNLEFDLKFLFRRCVILGIRPSFSLPFKGRHDKDFFCTMQAWCGRGEFISLSNLCAALNIETDNTMDGSMVCDYWLAGKYDEIATYNADDVQLALKAHSLLTFGGELAA